MSGIFPNILDGISFVAVDVGASHWLPSHWNLYEREFDFVLVEPDQNACVQLRGMIDRLPAEVAARYRIVPHGLSETGGKRTLYRTNTPTGSSLLKPKILDDQPYFELFYELDNSNYFLPVQEIEIDTITLQAGVEQAGHAAPHMIKLDTQGTELEIMRGLGDAAFESLTAVQTEIGMPGAYLDQPGLAEFLLFMKEKNFVLFDLQLSRGKMPLRGNRAGFDSIMETKDIAGIPTVISRLWEVDGVFMRDPMHLLRMRDKDGLRRLMISLCVYRMFPEAFQIAGLAEKEDIISYAEAAGYKRDILQSNRRLADALRNGYKIYW